MKTLYLIHHAKQDWEDVGASDFERTLTAEGREELNTIGSYLMIRDIVPDAILTSSALYAQETADALAKKVGYEGKIHYMAELYYTPPETLFQMVLLQENQVDSLFLVGHNPQLNDFANMLADEYISRIPSAGVAALRFGIERWEELAESKGAIEFFIFPKQFKYYMPRNIRAYL